MTIRYLLICMSVFFVISSCNKDKYETNPQISIESITQLVPVGGSMEVKLKFTQKAGKLGQGIFSSLRTRINQRPIIPGTGNADTIVGPIPQFPDQNQGEFNFTLDYNSLHESNDSESDTFTFRFSVIDRVGNKSDTITSPQVVVLSQ